jgi:hypothetical protein
MSDRRPEVFISATSADLRSCRQIVKEALLTLGCVPVEQANFPPDYRTVREMLRAKLSACDAVVHIAGECFGAEPAQVDPAAKRRSYTQMEYDTARQLGKPVYVFLCGDGFPYDPHPPEDADKGLLQQAHRAALAKSDTVRYTVRSQVELGLRVRELQTQVEHLRGLLGKTRSWLGRGLVAGLIGLAVVGGAIWLLNRRTARNEATIATLETALDRQRRYISQIADLYTQRQAELDQLKLTDQEKFDRALSAVARKDGVPEAELRNGLNLFIAAIQADTNADFRDRALAEFAQRNFAAAAEDAGKAASSAREKPIAAEKLVAAGTAAADEARTEELNGFNLAGQSYYADRKFGEASSAFTNALDAAPRERARKSRSASAWRWTRGHRRPQAGPLPKGATRRSPRTGLRSGSEPGGTCPRIGPGPSTIWQSP